VGGVNAGSWLALLISAAGIGLGFYTMLHNRPGNFDIYPEPKQGSRLVTTGPYRWVRHPMYGSLLLAMLGVTLFNGHALNAVGLATLTVVVFGKILKEERYLRQCHPEYAAYEQRTKRLIPYLV
jgi:protein-S-isoprenylcysteine O-methyltransferase Ste14